MAVRIGLEVHCQLTALKTKLFCSCSSDYRTKPPNSNNCPVCSGTPGALPLLSRKAVEFAGTLASALSCSVPDEVWFYRKNYFYPDLPKNFQITQYNAYGATSIGTGGSLAISGDRKIRIRRIQLEEDPGRLVYDAGMEKSLYALIDYSRAGVALVEVVTEPDLNDPREAQLFLDKIASILDHLGICDTRLEGAVRCDANISVDGGGRVEVKNVSSFADVRKALEYEATRQKATLSRGGQIPSETRHWDETRKVTKQSRSKEEEQDYRYFPEPDLPVVTLGGRFLEQIHSNMPELPDARKSRFIDAYGLSEHVAQVLINKKELADFMEQAVALYNSPKEIANWVVTDLMSFVDEREAEKGSLFSGIKVDPRHIAELARMVNDGSVNRATAKQILGQIVSSGEMPSAVAQRMQAGKISDAGLLEKTVDSVFASEAAAVESARSNPSAVNFLLGKVMQSTKGRADPAIALGLIRKKLETK